LPPDPDPFDPLDFLPNACFLELDELDEDSDSSVWLVFFLISDEDEEEEDELLDELLEDLLIALLELELDEEVELLLELELLLSDLYSSVVVDSVKRAVDS
jgi:hypothetical protein